MRALVLFKGTGSIDKALEAQGFEVTSLDILPKFGATFTEHVMTWDYRQFEPGHFDFVWASPVCTEFSVALTTRPRDLEKGDELAEKALEIIEYLLPQHWARFRLFLRSRH
jgi:site-specific DNA-cytosine methylase